MKTEYFKLVISETGSNTVKDEKRLFNEIVERFENLEEVKEFLVNRYGRMPGGRNKVYIDTKSGTKQAGFTHSFWNKDYSHNDTWHQTDWICVSMVKKESKPVLINR